MYPGKEMQLKHLVEEDRGQRQRERPSDREPENVSKGLFSCAGLNMMIAANTKGGGQCMI